MFVMADVSEEMFNDLTRAVIECDMGSVAQEIGKRLEKLKQLEQELTEVANHPRVVPINSGFSPSEMFELMKEAQKRFG